MKRRKGRSWPGIGIGQNEIFGKGCLCGEEEEGDSEAPFWSF